jgi:hypothetical protein
MRCLAATRSHSRGRRGGGQTTDAGPEALHSRADETWWPEITDGRRAYASRRAFTDGHASDVSTMTPEELADRHPRLYHVTTPGSMSGMIKHGLLSTSALLDLFEIAGEERAVIAACPRTAELTIEHPTHGKAIISDNSPLMIGALGRCLDDGLQPADWLRMLNERVFFWADRRGVSRLLDARVNRDRPREVVVVDTLSLAREFADRMEITPINTGATIRRPARRGLSTFAPIQAHTYQTWQRLRGRRDRVIEVTVRGGVPDIRNHLIDIINTRGGLSGWPR